MKMRVSNVNNSQNESLYKDIRIVHRIFQISVASNDMQKMINWLFLFLLSRSISRSLLNRDFLLTIVEQTESPNMEEQF